MKKFNHSKTLVSKKIFHFSFVALFIQTVLILPNIALADEYTTPIRFYSDEEEIYKESYIKVERPTNVGIISSWNIRQNPNNKKLKLITTNGDITVNATYGIRATTDKEPRDFTPELSISSYKDIIFNNSHENIEATGNNVLISLDANNGAIKFNLNVTNNTEELSMIEYTAGDRNKQGKIKLTSKLGNILSLKANLGNKDMYGVNTFKNVNTELNSKEGNNKITLETTAQDNAKSNLIGINTWINSTTKLNGKNNIIGLTVTGKSYSGTSIGIHAAKESNVELTAYEFNKIEGSKIGIYAKDSSTITLKGNHNLISSSDIAIKAKETGKISVNGKLEITAPLASYVLNKGDISLNYSDDSKINGALLADDGNILVESTGSTLNMIGDVLALNQGKVELNLTPNSNLLGRIDSFNAFKEEKHSTLFNIPSFITRNNSGTVNLNLAEKAVWKMTGQSWLSQLSGEGSVDFNRQATNKGRALHIDTLSGSNRFLMNLNKDGIHSDMLYIKKGTSVAQELLINNLSEVIDSMKYGDRLRFAIVKDSKNEFVAGKKYVDGSHLMEEALTVEYSDENNDPSNKTQYNKDFNGTEMTTEKAGDDYIHLIYSGGKNVYLVKQSTDNPSNNVKDINDMFDSSAHYAFTLDTHTKREGERAYSSLDKKDGAWVRAIHTKLTQSGVFRFHNNDYEIGYDKFSRNDTEKKRKWGLSFTYGRAKVSLSNQFSKGRIKKYELSFYNTNQRQNKEGDDSAYHDNVLRIGLLRSHSYARMNNGKLWGKGSYRNKYFTVSTEYGYRKFINDDKRWYVVPQAQLQFTYLNGVDYKLSNGVNVSLNHTKSLIGRVGIDIVRLLDDEREQKDLRERRFYIKGNILHEFLAKRSFIGSYSADNYSKTWNNRGTWYAIGLGYNAHVSEKTYIFIDAERELGAGRANSYNARLAISWQFK